MSVINWNRRIVLPRTELFWLDNYNHVVDKNLWISVYQKECRIYLDEYLEQKELRKAWFEKNHGTFKHIYTRFLRRN